MQVRYVPPPTCPPVDLFQNENQASLGPIWNTLAQFTQAPPLRTVSGVSLGPELWGVTFDRRTMPDFSRDVLPTPLSHERGNWQSVS